MFQIVTDSTADLTEEFYRENDIVVNELMVNIDGETYGPEKKLDIKAFYAKVRNGSMPSTGQVNPETAIGGIMEAAKKGKDILYIAFSSTLSGSYQSAVIAARQVKEEHPELNIEVVDSLSASMGEGVLVYEAVGLRKDGLNLKEAAEYLSAIATHSVHLFTVDDLKHLCRGGRLSRTSAVLGTILSVKPVLNCSREGRLQAIGKAHGRNKALRTIVDMMDEALGANRNKKNLFIGIAHGDCEAEALKVAQMIRERFGFENIMVNVLGPVTATHAGPGTIAVFFLGEKERDTYEEAEYKQIEAEGKKVS